MSDFYGSADEQESITVLNRSIELGFNLWDTAVRIYILFISQKKKKKDYNFFKCDF